MTNKKNKESKKKRISVKVIRHFLMTTHETAKKSLRTCFAGEKTRKIQGKHTHLEFFDLLLRCSEKMQKHILLPWYNPLKNRQKSTSKLLLYMKLFHPFSLAEKNGGNLGFFTVGFWDFGAETGRKSLELELNFPSGWGDAGMPSSWDQLQNGCISIVTFPSWWFRPI